MHNKINSYLKHFDTLHHSMFSCDIIFTDQKPFSLNSPLMKDSPGRKHSHKSTRVITAYGTRPAYC